ncbi:hypothetical protein BDZ45DRAFT_464495 [Acephala macrosclerotiorum]|nr:hypothetical protein BDZ45DRAFT_464495 [Acephala macrosclerotiorum]
MPSVLPTFFSMRRDYAKIQSNLSAKNVRLHTLGRDIGTVTLQPRHAVGEGKIFRGRVWQVYNEGLVEISNRSYDSASGCNWFTLTSNVRAFCLHIGSLQPVNDPLDNVARLRNHVLGQQLFNTMPLHDEIQKLKDTKGQRKLIAALFFRHLLENLSLIDGGYLGPNWQIFWKELWKNVKKEVKKNKGNLEAELPQLAELYKEYSGHAKGPGRINDAALVMYSTLSDIIHKYCDDSGNIVLSKSHGWHPMQYLLLKALTPRHNFGVGVDGC